MPQSKLTSVTCTSRFVEKWVVGFIDDGHVSSGLSILRFQTPTKRKKKRGFGLGSELLCVCSNVLYFPVGLHSTGRSGD